MDFEENKKNTENIAQTSQDPVEIPENGLNSKYIVVGGGFLVLLIAVIGSFLLLQSMQTGDVEDVGVYGVNPATDLRLENETYQRARFARRDLRDYPEAIKLYEEALNTTQEPDQRAQIRYELALAKDSNNEEIDAIRVLKQVAEDEESSRLIRASAVERMGRIFYTKHDITIFEEIFSGPFYADLLVVNDVDNSMKNLFEFASELYPLAYSELRIANIYANNALRSIEEGVAIDPPLEEVKAIIRTKISNADKDIEDLLNAYTSSGRVVPFLLRKAIVADKLQRLGDPFLGDPEILFEDVLRRARISAGDDVVAFTIYHFVDFLVQNYGAERRDSIVELMSNFYGDGRQTIESGRNEVFFEFLTNEKDDVSGARPRIVDIAEIDSSFKDLLVNDLGWEL